MTKARQQEARSLAVLEALRARPGSDIAYISALTRLRLREADHVLKRLEVQQRVVRASDATGATWRIPSLLERLAIVADGP